MPAFNQAHTHSPEMLGRGLLPMAGQTEWLTHAYADGRDALHEADIARAVRLCALETVRGGATSVTDHFRQFPANPASVRAAARAWHATGLRARLAINIRDRIGPDGKLLGAPGAGGSAVTSQLLALVDGLLAEALPVPVGIGPSAPQRVTNDLLRAAAARVREGSTFMHMHICESREDADVCRALYGESAVAHLDSLGILGPGVELVQPCTWTKMTSTS